MLFIDIDYNTNYTGLIKGQALDLCHPNKLPLNT